MLHAVNHRKARLAAFRATGSRVPLEDVVTSTVFGPLAFMADDDRAAALACVFEALSVPLSDLVGRLRLDFWPRLPVADPTLRARHSEPDLVVADDLGPLAVVEVKWGADLGERELAAQWAAIPPRARRRAVHLVLVQEPARYRGDIEDDVALVLRRGLGPWRPHLRTWRALAGLPTLTARPGVPDAVRRWAGAVSELLRREHRLAVHGWDVIDLRPVAAADWRFRRPWHAALRPVARHGGWWERG